MGAKRRRWNIGAGLLLSLIGVGACSDDQPTSAVERAVPPGVPQPSSLTMTPARGPALTFDRAVSIRYGHNGAPLTMQTRSTTPTDLGPWRTHAHLDIAPIKTGDENCHTRALKLAVAAIDGATEVWCPRGPTLEHAYQFTQRPLSTDLVVEVDVHGVRRGTVYGDRIRLQTLAGLALNYGKAAWLDANGERYPVELDWQAAESGDGGRLLLRVTASVLDRTAYPAVLDPELGPLVKVADSIYVPAEGNDNISAVAALGADVAVFLAGNRWVRLLGDGTVLPPEIAPGNLAGTVSALAYPLGIYALGQGTVGRLGTSGAWLSPTTFPTGTAGGPLSPGKIRLDGKVVVLGQVPSFNSDTHRTVLATNGVFLSQDVLPRVTSQTRTSHVAELDPQTLRYVLRNSLVDLEASTGTIVRTATAGSALDRAVMTDGSNRTVLGNTGGLSVFDATLNESVVAFGHPNFDYGMTAGLAASGDTLCTIARGASVNEVIATSVDLTTNTPGVGYPLPSVALINNDTFTQGTAFAGGFAFAYRTPNGEPRALLLDATCQPTHIDLAIVTEPNLQRFTALVKSGPDLWAVWRDERSASSELYGRRIGDDGTPIGTPAIGTNLGVVFDPANAVLTSVSNADRSAIAIHNAATDTLRFLHFDGSPVPAVTSISTPNIITVAPLVKADGSAYVVGRRDANCGAPPCGGALILANEAAEFGLVGQAFDYTEITSASRGDDHWVVVRADQTNSTEVRAMRIDLATHTVAEDIVVLATPSAEIQLVGAAIDDDGALAVVWTQATQTADTYQFATVRQGAANISASGDWPGGPRMLVSLDGGRGFLAGTALLYSSGEHHLDVDTAALGDLVTAASPAAGSVLLGVNSGQSIYTANLFVGDANGTACADDDSCSGGFCQEGVCCESECGLCERCDIGQPGKCAPAVNTSDDTCFGDRSCDSAGACKPANGETCMVDSDCASGFCIDGVCCDTACDDACGACQAGVGICTLIECGAYACAGGGECKQVCESTLDCAPDFVCGADERCITANAVAVPEEDGCGCRVVGRKPPGRRMGWLIALALGVVAVRRKSTRRGVSLR